MPHTPLATAPGRENFVSRFCTVTADGLKEAGNVKDLLVKPVVSYFDIKKLANGSLSPTETKIHGFASDAKKGLGAVELPGKVNDLRKSTTEFVKERSLSAGWDVFVKGAGCVSPVWDGMQLLQSQKIVNFTKSTMSKGLGVASGAMIVDRGNAAVRDLGDFNRNMEVYKTGVSEDGNVADRTSAMWKAAAKIQSMLRNGLLVLLGACTLTALVGVFALTPIALCAVATSTVVLGVTKFYTDKLLAV